MGDWNWEDINWTQEFLSAAVPQANDVLPLYRNDFRMRALNKGVANIIKNYGNPKLQDMHMKIFDAKIKGFDLAQKGLNFL